MIHSVQNSSFQLVSPQVLIKQKNVLHHIEGPRPVDNTKNIYRFQGLKIFTLSYFCLCTE